MRQGVPAAMNRSWAAPALLKLDRHHNLRAGRLTSDAIMGELATRQSRLMLTPAHELGGQPYR
jgi:hypothetical protein